MTMRANEKETRHLVQPEYLAAKLLELLAQTPATMDELAARTGYSADTVRLRLLRMEEASCVRREQLSLLNFGGFQYRWHATGEPLPDLARDAGAMAKRDGQPHQVTTKTYPAINRRDPLVACIFGPAGQAVP